MMLSFGLFQPSVQALSLLATTAVITAVASAPARAAVLSQWSFDPSTQQLQLNLPADLAPQYFLLAEPARIVLDIPNAQMGAIPTTQTYAGAVRSVRISQFEANIIRIVVELAPGVVLDPRQATLAAVEVNGQNRWILQPLLAGEAAIATAPNPITAPANVPPEPAAPNNSAAAVRSGVDETFVSPVSPLEPATVEPPLPIINSEGIGLSAASLLIGPDVVSQSELPATPLTGIPPAGVDASVTVSVPPLGTTPAVTAPPRPVAEPVAPTTDLAVPETASTATEQPPVSPTAADVPISPPFLETTTAIEAAPNGAPPFLAADESPLEATAETETASASQPVAETTEAIAADTAVSTTLTNQLSPPVPAQPLPELSPPQPTAPPQTALESPPFLETEPATTPLPQVAAPTTVPALPPTAAEAPSERTPTIPFGQPLPPTEQSTAPAAAPLIARQDSDSVLIPAGTQLPLQYTQPDPLALNDPINYQEVLVLSQDVRHPQTNELLIPKGALVVGRFDLTATNPRFIAQAISLQGQNLPLSAESDVLGNPQVSGSNVLRNSGLGAAAITVLSGFSGIGLVAGAALGAATSYATSPPAVVIQPNQIIQVQVLEDLRR
ncbi:AMIN domain-containing protein [Almyronema epifaneia]|uniref:AMIN domain-containing protein n=1 Tax=Almyronema epifaneia S1 TaxID=2991925 RepID=A0ABW6IJ33_9CYAN